MSSRLGEESTYEVRIRGRLDESWLDWLNGVTMTFEGEPGGPGTTILTGHLDQAALRGLLTRLWDLNLTVVSVAVRDSPRSHAPRQLLREAFDRDDTKEPEAKSPVPR